MGLLNLYALSWLWWESNCIDMRVSTNEERAEAQLEARLRWGNTLVRQNQ